MIVAILAPHGIDPTWVKAAIFFIVGGSHRVKVESTDGTAAKVQIKMCEGDKPEHMPEALRRVSDALHELFDKAYDVAGEVIGLPDAHRWLAAEHGLNS